MSSGFRFIIFPLVKVLFKYFYSTKYCSVFSILEFKWINIIFCDNLQWSHWFLHFEIFEMSFLMLLRERKKRIVHNSIFVMLTLTANLSWCKLKFGITKINRNHWVLSNQFNLVGKRVKDAIVCCDFNTFFVSAFMLTIRKIKDRNSTAAQRVGYLSCKELFLIF